MEVLRFEHRAIIASISLVSIVGLILQIYIGLIKGEVLGITQSGSVIVTTDVPHYITLAIKPESRIPPTGNDSLLLSVEIRPPSSLIPVYTTSVTANNNGVADLGSVSANTIPPGMYDIAIKGLSHLRKVYPNQTFDGSASKNFSLLVPQLPAGDANPTADNYVNSLDISYLALNLYTSDLRADLNRDTLVNSLDFTALLRNLYVNGDN